MSLRRQMSIKMIWFLQNYAEVAYVSLLWVGPTQSLYVRLWTPHTIKVLNMIDCNYYATSTEFYMCIPFIKMIAVLRSKYINLTWLDLIWCTEAYNTCTLCKLRVQFVHNVYNIYIRLAQQFHSKTQMSLNQSISIIK